MAARMVSIIELGSPQALAILDEIPRHLIAECAEHEVDRALKECAIRPHAKRPWNTGVSCWKLRWRRDPRFQLTHDDLRVTINVRIDLHRGHPFIRQSTTDAVLTFHDGTFPLGPHAAITSLHPDLPRRSERRRVATSQVPLLTFCDTSGIHRGSIYRPPTDFRRHH
jgi:hypothetical protein